MKVMLTSFGVEQALGGEHEGDSVFYRMPPVSYRRVTEAFLPDYELLLLCDSVVLDEASFQRLEEDRFSVYSEVADTFKALRSEGRVELVDFASIVRANGPLLDRMLEHDIQALDQWVEPLRESLGMWRRFVDTYRSLMYEEHKHHSEFPDQIVPEGNKLRMRNVHNMHAMAGLMHEAMSRASYAYSLAEDALISSSKRRRKEYRDPLREMLQAYLAYVNANLVISNELELPFHDWQDFFPFYSMKFLSVGKAQDKVSAQHEHVQKLFTVSFPDLAISDVRGLLKALSDKRIEDLRALVGDAVVGKVKFDDEFAKAVLSEVLRGERKANRFRSVIGYATLPIGFIPFVGTPVQKVVEEAISRPAESKMKKKHRWFHMLSDIAGEPVE